MPRFIEITIDPSVFTERARVDAVVASCPVDIHAVEDGQLKAVDSQVDECILGARRLIAFPPGGVEIRRQYGAGRTLCIPGDESDKGAP